MPAPACGPPAVGPFAPRRLPPPLLNLRPACTLHIAATVDMEQEGSAPYEASGAAGRMSFALLDLACGALIGLLFLDRKSVV